MATRVPMIDVKSTVTDYALELGFDLVRVTSSDEFAEDREAALERLDSGLMDGLPWYSQARVLKGTDPQQLLPGARSIISLGLNYYRSDVPAPNNNAPSGKVARYAWGRDYHRVMKKRMRTYVEGLQARLGTDLAARWYVDDGPMLDRAAARRAGLGWFGKNGNILTSSHGSWVFLGQVITDLELEADQPLKKSCGSCVTCIDACPTGAIVAHYVVDNARCISYLTIENRGPIPLELRPQVGDWVFGCDICQDVCPVNRKAHPSTTFLTDGVQSNSGSSPVTLEWANQQGDDLNTLDLVWLLEMSEEQFRARFRGTPILRAKRVGLQRNACVALGNRGDPVTVPALRRAVINGESLVRAHAAWALGQIGTAEAQRALQDADAQETDLEVLQEISAALKLLGVAVRAESS